MVLKKGDAVVFQREQRTASGPEQFTGYGHVESVHGEWVAIRYRFGNHECFCAAKRDEVFPEEPAPSDDAHVLQQAMLFVDAFMRGLDANEGADAISERLRVNLIKMHAIGFMEGQGVTLSEPWEWAREAHRVASAFVRYHDFCAQQDGAPMEDLPDAARVCQFLVWAKGAIRDGGGARPEQVAMVYCATAAEAKEGGDA